ncbi:ATPase, T2SS/T4P/T4SS family, partial [Escherichia coli]
EGTAQLPVTNVETEQQRGEEYRKAITAALRSDPDIIMPGEARDAEVINLLFTAAMTGHQVWTSLHANNAIAIFDRLK